ncbi:Hypothetical protein FKW44_007442, partial [Caligus rogercresseyi]
MPACLGIHDEDNSGYADDTCIWAVANDLTTIGRLLTERAEAFYRFATGNGLKMNASKTQLLIGGSAKASEVKTFTIPIDRVD